jgi:hypothetical protein
LMAHWLERCSQGNSVVHILMPHDLRYSTVRSLRYNSKNDSDLVMNSSWLLRQNTARNTAWYTAWD